MALAPVLRMQKPDYALILIDGEPRWPHLRSAGPGTANSREYTKIEIVKGRFFRTLRFGKRWRADQHHHRHSYIINLDSQFPVRRIQYHRYQYISGTLSSGLAYAFINGSAPTDGIRPYTVERSKLPINCTAPPVTAPTFPVGQN